MVVTHLPKLGVSPCNKNDGVTSLRRHPSFSKHVLVSARKSTLDEGITLCLGLGLLGFSFLSSALCQVCWLTHRIHHVLSHLLPLLQALRHPHRLSPLLQQHFCRCKTLKPRLLIPKNMHKCRVRVSHGRMRQKFSTRHNARAATYFACTRTGKRSLLTLITPAACSLATVLMMHWQIPTNSCVDLKGII